MPIDSTPTMLAAAIHAESFFILKTSKISVHAELTCSACAKDRERTPTHQKQTSTIPGRESFERSSRVEGDSRVPTTDIQFSTCDRFAFRADRRFQDFNDRPGADTKPRLTWL